MDRRLGRLSTLLILTAGIIVLPIFSFQTFSYERWLETRATPLSLILLGAMIVGLVMAEGGEFLHYYAKTKNTREALFNTLVGFGVVIALIVAGVILRR